VRSGFPVKTHDKTENLEPAFDSMKGGGLQAGGAMTIDVLNREAHEIKGRSSAYRDNVLPDLAAWSERGERCALVTLVGVDGNAPRAEGAQMAVSETGQWAGYISGGCLEQAIALEAVQAIKAGRPRLLRYGKGSPYFDIQLPCGSGLDVLVEPFGNESLIRDMRGRMERREPFALRIDLESGAAGMEAAPADGQSPQSHPEGKGFVRVYMPPLQCVIIGSSPIAVKLAELSAGAGFETHFYAPDAENLPALPAGVRVHSLLPGTAFPADRWTAAVLAFHDHEKELPVFRELLRGQCFYLSAIGSRRAHAARRAALETAGFSQAEIARIQSPAGLIPELKSAPLVAVSILAQVVAAARERRIVA
jgi:xanthine dehydrogenase accessory factor